MSNSHSGRSLRVLDDIWNTESHGAALELLPSDFSIDDDFVPKARNGPLMMLNLVHVYKACVPDLHFSVQRQVERRNQVVTVWSAEGHYSCRALGHAPLGSRIRITGSFIARETRTGPLRIFANHWDCRAFAGFVGASKEEFANALTLGTNEIRVRAFPGRAGTPIVVFPTLSLPGWIGWRRFLRRYEGRREIITFQLLGNRSALEGGQPVRGYSVRKETLAIEECLRKANMASPFDVLAHSAGGCFALDFALRNPLAVRSLTLIEPALGWVLRSAGALDAELRNYIKNRMKLYRPGISESQYVRFIQDAMAPDARTDPRQSPYWPDIWAYRENMKYRSAIYTHRDTVDRLREIRCPVLLVRGRHSDRFHRKTIDVLASSLPASRTIVMRGGHSPHFGPGVVQFTRHLSRFLAEAGSCYR